MLFLIREKDKTRERNLLLNLLSEFKFKGIRDFQKKIGLYQDGVFGEISYNALYKHILRVEKVNFKGGYYTTETQKNMIVWHHSAGWDDARGMFSWWLRDGRKHVATSVGIDDEGKLYKGFDEKYWAHHIGCKVNDFNQFGLPSINSQLNRQSIGVEVCNAGALDDFGVTWYGHELPKDKVVEVNFRDKRYYEKITDKECDTLKYWTLLNALRYSIPLYYREFEMWNVSKEALSGVAGIYTHNSFRRDKTDISPQENVIKAAKELSKYYK